MLFPNRLCVLIISFLCSYPQLEQCWNKYTEREEQTSVHHAVVAVEEVDEFSIVHLWHEVEHKISHRIVHPMKYEAWQNTTRFRIEPTQ